MTVELRPYGVACNLGCTYCYQEPIREAGNGKVKYDFEKMIAEAKATGQPFSLFGGEALLLPLEDLEKFFKVGYELFKHNGIQTNGTLITDSHIELFKKYNVGVGISIDGPEDLNKLREVRKSPGNQEETLKSTQIIIDNIVKLVKAGIIPSIIITLHKANGTVKQLPRLKKFIRWLGDIGIKNGNVHVLEVDKTMPDQDINVLSQDENIEAMIDLAKFFGENQDISWMPFSQFRDILIAKDSCATCYWHNCDHMNTQAVYGIDGNGSLSNCGRTAKEGIDFYKASDRGFQRYISLYNFEDEHGGCKGCRYWITCSGNCPGESINQDFRNKTIHCKTQKALHAFYEDELEREGITPITKSSFLKDLENIKYNHLVAGSNPSIHECLKILKSMKEQ